MGNIEEKMMMMMVEMATKGGKMEARQEAQDKVIVEMQKQVELLHDELAKRDARIVELEAMLMQQENARPKVVVNQFFMLSVLRTRDYVSNLNNDGRQFVGHMLHQTMSEETPHYLMEQVDEITRLIPQEGSVVIQHNNGPVNGNITTQNVGAAGMQNENMQKQIDSDGREKGRDADTE